MSRVKHSGKSYILLVVIGKEKFPRKRNIKRRKKNKTMEKREKKGFLQVLLMTPIAERTV